MRIAVIGGGLGGLAAAHALVGAGFDAHVLEASPSVGGVVRTSRVDGFLREHAASSFLGGPPRGALALCHELGVPVERASKRARVRWIYIDGQLRALPRSPLDVIRTDLLTWRGKLALLREPLAKARAAGTDESMHDFAARRFGPEAARAIIAPAVTGVFAADSHDISLDAGFPKLAELDTQGGVFRGAAKQLASGLYARALRRPSAGTPRGLWAPVGGVGAIIDALSTFLGTRVKTNARVQTISPGTDGVVVDREKWDAVVLATPADDAAALTAAAMPELSSKLRVFERAPAALVYLGVRAVDVPAAANGFGALIANGEDARVLGIVFESTVWPDRAPAGVVLLRCIFGGTRDPGATELSDPDLIELALRDLDIVLGANVDPVHTSVVRWKQGIAQYRVGHRDHVRAAVAAGRTQRVTLAGADYRGAGLNDLCADRDVIVAEMRTWT